MFDIVITEAGVPPEPEDCVREVSGVQAIISSEDVIDRKTLSEKEGIPLDCLWNITVKEGWKVKKKKNSIIILSLSPRTPFDHRVPFPFSSFLRHDDTYSITSSGLSSVVEEREREREGGRMK